MRKCKPKLFLAPTYWSLLQTDIYCSFIRSRIFCIQNNFPKHINMGALFCRQKVRDQLLQKSYEKPSP